MFSFILLTLIYLYAVGLYSYFSANTHTPPTNKLSFLYHCPTVGAIVTFAYIKSVHFSDFLEAFGKSILEIYVGLKEYFTSK